MLTRDLANLVTHAT